MSKINATCALLVVVAAACIPPPLFPRTPLPAPSSSAFSDQALAAKVGAYMKQRAADLSFSGAALVARRGHVLLQKGYGTADRRWKIPNTEQTQFRIASVSKEFAAVAILLLEAQGRLDVHDRICVYVSGCPSAWTDITVHQLLTHTSGIHNLYDQPGYAVWQATPAAPAEVMQRFIDLPLDFPPGQSWKYSNSGYVVLGQIIERVSGKPYSQFLQDSVFTPLDMRNTGIVGARRLAPGYANCCDLTPADTSDPTVDLASGDLYSTVGDLYSWDRALFDDRFLSPHLREIAFTPYEYMSDFGGVGLEGTALSYGYGFMIGEMYGQRFVGHTGRIEGYSSLNFYFPDDQVALILLSNQRNPSINSIVSDLASMVLGPSD